MLLMSTVQRFFLVHISGTVIIKRLKFDKSIRLDIKGKQNGNNKPTTEPNLRIKPKQKISPIDLFELV